MEQGSEVARVMQQIDLELEAVDRALHGFAITARHDFINARMQRGGERILRLIDEGRHEEAQALMNSEKLGHAGRRRDEKTGACRKKTGRKNNALKENKRDIKRANGDTKREKQGEQRMKTGEGFEFPLLPISFHDLAALRSILNGYLAYLRRMTPRTEARQRLLQVLQGVYQRLTGISAQAVGVRIVLSVEEVEAVNTAMLGFAAFVRQKVAPSREREETLQTVEQLRQYVMRILSN